jgi:glutathione S-transferase
MLGEKKLEATLIQEPFWKRREAFLAMNPAGQIPVLVDNILIDPCKPPQAHIIAHSAAICEYLDEAYVERNFMGSDPLLRAEIRRIAAWFDEKFFMEVSGPLLFERVYKRLLNQGVPDSKNIRRSLDLVYPHMDYLNKLLKERYWLAGEPFSVADFAAAAHLSTLDYFGSINWDLYEHSREWYARIKCRPSFRPLLQDRLPSVPPEEIYENLDF